MQSPGYRSRMRDSDIVEAIVSGDPQGLATAYDTYAASLYVYCKAMLRDPADAADAVQDTFVVAASRLGGLRDRDLLRPWLYAVARNECRRRLRARATTSVLEEVPDVTDEQADVSADAERAELQALIRAAVLGLNPTEQEVIELQLRQGLDGGEVADVLGVSRNHAHALISRARSQLEVCLGVLLVARTGREACAELDTLLEGWDGQLNPLLRKRLNRHIERCAICSDRRRVELAPAMLLGIAPLAAVAVTATAPNGLREQVLHMAASNSPEAVAHRATVASRTTQFGQHGFPKPFEPSATRHLLDLRHSRSAQVAAAMVAAAAVVTIVAVALSGGGGPHRAEASGPGAATSAPASGAGSSGSAGAPNPGPSGRFGPSGASGPGASGPASGQPGTVGQISPGTGAQPSPGASPGSSSTSPGSPGSSSPAPRSSSPSSTPPSSGHPTPTTPAPTTPTPPPPRPGTLTVAPTSVVLSTLGGTQITITAVGGPVSWSISEPSSLLGNLSVSPSAGSLQAGQSATVVVSVNGLLSLDTVLTVNPGGHAITVVLGLL